MKQILVPTDFSTCANNALNFAIQSAKLLPVEVTLLHSFEIKGSSYTDYMGLTQEFRQYMLDEIETKLKDIKESIEETEGITVKTIISKKSLKDSILDVAEDKFFDLIVMGTLGASGIKEKLWGSNTAKIIGSSNVPVLAIPYKYEWIKPKKISIATNHFEEDPEILDLLFEMADLYMAQVHAVVFDYEKYDDEDPTMQFAEKIPKYEMLLKEKYNEESLTVSQITGTDFEKSLQEYIAINEVDMLAMISYQRSFWNRIFDPSMTRRMAYHTKIPLLVISSKK